MGDAISTLSVRDIDLAIRYFEYDPDKDYGSRGIGIVDSVLKRWGSIRNFNESFRGYDIEKLKFIRGLKGLEREALVKSEINH